MKKEPQKKQSLKISMRPSNLARNLLNDDLGNLTDNLLNSLEIISNLNLELFATLPTAAFFVCSVMLCLSYKMAPNHRLKSKK